MHIYPKSSPLDSIKEVYLQEKFKGLLLVMGMLKFLIRDDINFFNNVFIDFDSHIDSRHLRKFDDLVLPGIGYAIYSKKKNCFVVSKDLSSKSLVGRFLPANHIGAKAMEMRKEVLAIGRMMMGDLIACASPIEDNNVVVGFISVGEQVRKICNDLKNVEYSIDYLESKTIKVIDQTFHEILYGYRMLPGTGSKASKTVKIVSKSEKMNQIMNTLERVGPTDASILIEGETGTGKEIIARYLHSVSKRNNGNFVAVNCAAVPDNLIESELFGYEEGSFTGASKTKAGKIELANGGTLFLDEIGDMSLNLQAKLLRVLEERELERLGSLKKEVLDIRLVAATNKNIKKLVMEKKFRSDLYHRLAVITLFVPPLRERIEDIMPLVQYYMDYYCNNYGYKKVKLKKDVVDALLKYSFKGNVRELKNIVERMLIFKGGETVFNEDLIKILDDSALNDSVEEQGLKAIIRGEKERLEESMIRDALKNFNGNRTKTARFLNISRRSLQNKLKYYGIP